MNTPIYTSNRVRLCEWSGPVTAIMVAPLLSQLRGAEQDSGETTVLILHLCPTSARSILRCSSAFMDVLRALWVFCQEVVIACPGEPSLLAQLRRRFCGSGTSPTADLARPFTFFGQLDEAFMHLQGVFPHDVLELQRQMLCSGTWPAVGSAARPRRRCGW
jgi:hypothetical protein